MRGVERAGHLQRNDAGLGRRVLGQGLELLEGAGGNGLAGAVDVGRRCAGGLDGRQDLGGVPAHHGAHAGGGDGGGGGHAVGALPDEGHGFLLGEDAGQGGRRDLTDRVAGEDDRKGAEFDVEQGLRGHQAGGDDQGLRHGGVLDGFLIRGGPVGREVDACDFAEGGQLACYRGQFQPRGQKTRGL